MKRFGLALLFLWAFGAAAAETVAVTPSGPHSTPQECLQSLKNYGEALGKANHDLVSSPEDYRTAVLDKVAAQAAVYAAQFKPEALHGDSLKDLALLHGQAAQWPQARAALERRLDEPGLTATDRTKTLNEAILSFATFQGSTRVKDRDRLVDDLIARLDAMGDAALHERMSARSLLIGRDSDRAALERNVATYRRLFSQLPAEERGREYFGLYRSYTALADSYVAQGDYPAAARELRAGVDALTGDPKAAQILGYITYDLGRYEQVGKPAPALVAAHWLNASPPDGRMDMKGGVALLEFTAHWCVPCRGTYPAMEAWHRKYADKGLKVAFVTELFGWYERKRNVSPEEELAGDREYFLGKHGITFPIAIADKPQTMMRNPNAQNYFAQGVPQMVLIDRKGIIREVKVGLEKEDEAALEARIEKLLE